MPGRSAAQADLLRRLGNSIGSADGSTANLGLADTNVWGAAEGVPLRVRRRRLMGGRKGALAAVLARAEKRQPG